ncbi:reverse transcriptase [Cucumis melo var. makuwa]|uniref:Reverse transcriptase n=1 Tax=Cucumis melo var. makuwa TaxID=1194695 RepID=A0A5A7T1G9_CUCMM|nr:reverse transcriptase [Cucumis melo var. makuwa]TYK13863.1 reverse transcriptase [Cucumis melo var. makuwa]
MRHLYQAHGTMHRFPFISTPILASSTHRRLSNQPTLPVIHRQSPPNSNLQNCQICTAMQICPSTLYNNLSSMRTGLTNSIKDRGLKQASHRHPLAQSKSTDLPMYSKNPNNWRSIRNQSSYVTLQETMAHQGSVLETPRSVPKREMLFLQAAHLINKMSSRILHLQTPLDCLKESYPSTRLVSEVPFHVFRKYFVTMDVTFCKDRPYFPVSHLLQGKSVSEESNSTFKFIKPTPSTVSDVDPHPIILPANQVPWKTYYNRNLRKEIGENDKSDVVLENVEEKYSGDDTEVRTKTSNNEVKQSHTRKLDEYDPSLDIPITLRKGIRSCTKHLICNYVSYDNLSSQFRAFTASFDSIPKIIYTALECPKWKNVVMEEM